jgi:nitroreductase
MDVWTALMTRRSVRKYQQQPVPPERIEKLLRAAMQAPSARNAQPWEFILLEDRNLLAEIPNICPNAPMAAQAPVGIVVCGNLDREKSEGFWVIDCSAAIQNMLLAAHGLGLGAVWCGIYPRQQRVEGIGRLLGLPERVIPHSLVLVGYPAESPQPEDRYQPERIYKNRWGQRL